MSAAADQGMNDVKQAIRTRALGFGFDAVGFAPAAGQARERRHLLQFLAEGRHGEMAWMAVLPERRADASVLWPDARSVICLAINYGPTEDARAINAERDRGAISVYARGEDYHRVVKRKLKNLARWLAAAYACQVKVFCDTAPVMEKPLAERAGIGWIGKHTNLVSRRFGSWLFLGEVATTLDLAPDAAETDHCGSCRRCLDACPTGALPEPYRIEPRRCISYLTIEHKSAISPDLAGRFANRIYGCDECLAVCPWNRFAAPTGHEDLRPRAELTRPRLGDLAALDGDAFRRVFAGTAIRRIGRDRLVRNVLLAMANGDRLNIAAVRRLLEDTSPLVRAAAASALSRLAEKAGREP